MSAGAPDPATGWKPLTAAAIDELWGESAARWWLSGGVALDHWLGRPIRERPNADVSTTDADLGGLIDELPAGYSAWAFADEAPIAWSLAPRDEDLQPIRIHDDRAEAWVLQVNVEDGTDRAWLYRRDARLQLPWDRAVLDVGGIPTGAPEIQLLWKALRPRPEDDVDKDAILPELTPEARAWWERAILSIHPHSTWSIHIRSPLTPAKPSWNRPAR